MAFPHYLYRDPAEQAAQRESLDHGCAGCDKHQKHPVKSGHHCELGVKGYPDNSDKNCDWWYRAKSHKR